MISGVAAAFAGNQWIFGWPWASVATLVVISLMMYLETGPAMRRLRAAAGFTNAMEIGSEANPKELAAAQEAVRPWVSTTIGGVGLLILLWLMVFQPF